MLWFAFKIVSLTYFIHRFINSYSNYLSCDLLSKLYLWLTSYIQSLCRAVCTLVVICFQNCIFDLLHTSYLLAFYAPSLLWFAFKIVSLTYFIHQWYSCLKNKSSCDLLSKLYLWLTSYIMWGVFVYVFLVVICFQNCIFDLLHTSTLSGCISLHLLWFAFKIVSLTYFIHHLIICKLRLTSCDLLSKLYLWLTSYIRLFVFYFAHFVVICFQNCIFDLLHTSTKSKDYQFLKLWFAFKIVSLTYFIHQCALAWIEQKSCDLLSKLYLWLTSYISNYLFVYNGTVVICFQNCIFDLLHTSL